MGQATQIAMTDQDWPLNWAPRRWAAADDVRVDGGLDVSEDVLVLNTMVATVISC